MSNTATLARPHSSASTENSLTLNSQTQNNTTLNPSLEKLTILFKHLKGLNLNSDKLNQLSKDSKLNQQTLNKLLDGDLSDLQSKSEDEVNTVNSQIALFISKERKADNDKNARALSKDSTKPDSSKTTETSADNTAVSTSAAQTNDSSNSSSKTAEDGLETAETTKLASDKPTSDATADQTKKPETSDAKVEDSNATAGTKAKKTDTLFHKITDKLKVAPAVHKAFQAYANNDKDIQKKLSKTAIQVSLLANMSRLLFRNSKAAAFAGNYAYRGMVGVATLAKFTKVSKNNDAVATVASIFKTLSAFNVFHLASMPFKALGLKNLNFNIGFSNVYSFFGAANGPMNWTSAAAKRMMPKEGYQSAGDSLKAFKQQLNDTISAIKKDGMGAFDPRKSTGANGTVGGILQMIGFGTKQTGLHLRKSGNPLAEVLVTTGNVLRDNVACVATDCERFSKDNMDNGREQSVASGVNYTTEGVLDVLLNLPFLKKYENVVEPLMGMFGTWAAAANTAAVKEETADFKGKPYPAKNIPEFITSAGKAMLKANSSNSLPDFMANAVKNMLSKKEMSAQPA